MWRSLALFVLLLPCAQGQKLLDILSEELERNFSTLQKKAEPAPYYLAYSVVESDNESVTATLGTLLTKPRVERSRSLDVTIRVGSKKLDNYHAIRGDLAQFTSGVAIAIEDNPNAIKRKLWEETDRCYRLAAQRLINIRTNKDVMVADKEASDDFSLEQPSTFSEATPKFDFDAQDWAKRARKLSAEFAKYAGILNSNVSVAANREVKYFVNSEGTRLMHGQPSARVMLHASGKASDGMDLTTFDDFSSTDPRKLPKDEAIQASIERVAKDLAGLLAAPVVDPYIGPAILSGKAAGVFFHEIFGHRVEGHRLKDESDGQTFGKSVGKPVLPDFLSVIFDPTKQELAGTDLNGWYKFDDEGVKARRVAVVENGILKTFLMSRTPIPNFPNSNGHGRRQAGAEVVSRQSNLIVEATRTVSEAKLKELLIEEVKKKNKPYGFYFQEITGGFTNTSRRGIQAFKVIPLVVYRIHPDGREELVRGADIVGTPLASFAKIIAASDRVRVFNGFCGAESGSVPVSAASPSILVSELEIQKKESSRERPPLLGPPPTEGDTQ